jgi:hypothetical protein
MSGSAGIEVPAEARLDPAGHRIGCERPIDLD